MSEALARKAPPPIEPPRAPGAVALRASTLRKTYRLGRVSVPVLSGTTLDVRRGEWIAILGSSGSGKSTLLHLLGDLDRPDEGGGEVIVEGRSLSTMTSAARNEYRNRTVGFVFQFYHLLPELDVRDNTLLPAYVAMAQRPRGARIAHVVLGCLGALGGATAGWYLPQLGLAALADGAAAGSMTEVAPAYRIAVLGMLGALGLVIGAATGAAAGAGLSIAIWSEARALWVRFGPPRARLRRRADELLGAFGLGHRLHHRPRELSGGERQRVAIARALINEPDFLLADEPTGNLDERTGAEILDLLSEQHRRGLSIVMVTHDRAIAERADRVVELHDGRIQSLTR